MRLLHEAICDFENHICLLRITNDFQTRMFHIDIALELSVVRLQLESREWVCGGTV